jgi:hypothetical protein
MIAIAGFSLAEGGPDPNSDVWTGPNLIACLVERPLEQIRLNDEVQNYPGDDPTISTLLGLADEFHTAAMSLIGKEDPYRLTLFAPARLCVLQAIELYLNTFLRFEGMPAQEVRAFQHRMIPRAEAARAHGLILKVKTLTTLAALEDSREYLLVRYAPEKRGALSQLPRLFSALDDVTRKVRAAILNQPYQEDDPRFRRIWQVDMLARPIPPKGPLS